MKRACFILLVTVLAAIWAMAEEKSTVVIKGTETVGAVIIITGQPATPVAGKHNLFELQCTKGMSFCASPKPGEYVMVRLPKNWGIYECANVDLYPNGAETDTGQKIGEYCLTEK